MRDDKVFIDTNILFYSRQLPQDTKSKRAVEWLRMLVEAKRACLNLQVLNELANVLLRKRSDLSAQQVFAAVDELIPLGITGIDISIVIAARGMRASFGYSWWDCLLLSSALDLGCSHFLSEDMQDGQVVEDGGGKRLTIVDPFAHSPEQILISR